jgi:peroxiredoxin
MLLAPLILALALREQAPEFALPDQSGKTVRLSEARGHKVVLVFYRGYW